MIIFNCEQGSDEWFEARRGIPSASNFSKIITPKGKDSGSSSEYMRTLVNEYYAGKNKGIKTQAMDRGNALEPAARKLYEAITGTEARQVGLIYKDVRKLISASPDGLFEEGGLEIKCPNDEIHEKYLKNETIPIKYIPQVQGGMYVTGFDWWDFMSFHPGYEPLIVRIFRDEKYITALAGKLERFISKMLEKREKLTREIN